MLRDHCVHIDSFFSRTDYVCGSGGEGLFLLTHAHLDHITNAKRFPIVCTETTARIAGITPHRVVVPRRTYRMSGVVFSVFSTVHSPGSVGFYFHDPINVLHVGDSRVDASMLAKLRSLVGDGAPRPVIVSDPTVVRHPVTRYPSIEHSRQVLLTLFDAFSGDVVVGVHTDSLRLLLDGLFTPVQTEGFPALRAPVARALRGCSGPRTIRICGRLPRVELPPTNLMCLEPSMLFFVNDHEARDPWQTYVDRRGATRFFFATHASPQETSDLREMILKK